MVAGTDSKIPEGPWRFEPLPLSDFAEGESGKFPLGEAPFRVRGLAYVTLLDYIDKRLPGGRKALKVAMGAKDPWAAYLDQLFVVMSDYDVRALVRAFVIVSAMKQRPIGAFIERRSQSSAKADVHGMWKPLLKTSSPEVMASRLHMAFNRYFQPAEARPRSVASGRFEAVLTKLPEPMSGLYVYSTRGFVNAALELSGAQNIAIEFTDPEPDGVEAGTPLVRAGFVATWSPA